VVELISDREARVSSRDCKDPIRPWASRSEGSEDPKTFTYRAVVVSRDETGAQNLVVLTPNSYC